MANLTTLLITQGVWCHRVICSAHNDDSGRTPGNEGRSQNTSGTIMGMFTGHPLQKESPAAAGPVSWGKCANVQTIRTPIP